MAGQVPDIKTAQTMDGEGHLKRSKAPSTNAAQRGMKCMDQIELDKIGERLGVG